MSERINKRNSSLGAALHNAGTASLNQVIPPPITGAVASMAIRMESNYLCKKSTLSYLFAAE